jgi:hypothetical protein
MGLFAKRRDKKLVEKLVLEIADANKSSSKNFLHVLASCIHGDQELHDDHIKKLNHIIIFCKESKNSNKDYWYCADPNILCLNDMVRSAECRSMMAIIEADPAQTQFPTLNDLRHTAAILIDTRDALANALNLLERVRPTLDVKSVLMPSLKLRRGSPTDRPSTRTDPTVLVYSSRPAGSAPPPRHPRSTSSPSRTAAA